MAAVDLDHLPAGIVVLPEVPETAGHLDPGAWVDAARRPTRRRLSRPVAEYLTEAREYGEA